MALLESKWRKPHLDFIFRKLTLGEGEETLKLLTHNLADNSLGCMHLPVLSHSGSGTWVVLRGADSVGPAFCALPRSEQLR